ncbi:MAG: VWA domain-containing protein [Bryobacteraceae bacterium]
MGRFRNSTLSRREWLALLAAAPVAAQETFRMDVRLVRLMATVKDARGALVSSLAKEDFRLTENGVPQDVVLFERESGQPLSVTLLLDTSGSTAIELKYEVESVRKFLRAIFQEGNPNDAVSLYTFNYEVTIQSNFTRRIQRLEGALRSIKSEGGTSMYDALYLSSEALGTRDGRHVIVIVTDGGDTTSTKKFHDALEAVQGADAVIYPVLVIPIASDPGRNRGGENALETLAVQTGGRVFLPSISSLDRAFDDILRDLRTQYVIGYYPKNVPRSKDRFHKVELTVNKPGYRVQARTGYFGDYDVDAPNPGLGQSTIKPKH